MFSSVEQMDFKETSRKDDMISLCYLLFFILNQCEMPGMSHLIIKAINDKNVDFYQIFKILKKFKSQTSMFKMSKSIKLKTNINQSMKDWHTVNNLKQ
jgi:hypothetical protein